MKILDPCCGSKMMWFDKENKETVYGDIRDERHILCDGRSLNINPDVLIDFTKLPYDNEQFHLIVFDPPHLKNVGKTSWMAKKFGVLGRDWKDDLRSGFSECWRVLKINGTLIFKWNETQIKLVQLRSLFPAPPLFGHTTTNNLKTHWIVFYKP